jgi:hypothetical protein
MRLNSWLSPLWESRNSCTRLWSVPRLLFLKTCQENRGEGTLWHLLGSLKGPSEHLHTLYTWMHGEGKWLRVSARKRSSIIQYFCKIGWCWRWTEARHDSSNTIRPRLQCPKFVTSKFGTARALCCTSGKDIEAWERFTTTGRHFTQSWAGLGAASRANWTTGGSGSDSRLGLIFFSLHYVQNCYNVFYEEPVTAFQGKKRSEGTPMQKVKQ